jgi:uncharacterized membrane protein
MVLRWIITVLCGVGLYASIFMLRKTSRADRGLLDERSVVQTPRARLFAGIPNAALGVVYYALAGIGVWSGSPVVADLLAAAALAAAATSVVLAYSLLFVTRMPCVYCWTSHAVNWILAAFLIFHAIHPAPAPWR